MSKLGSLLRGLGIGALATLASACGDAGPAPEGTARSTEANTVCGQNTVHGMDVSHYDGTVDWATAKANGIDFAIVKATESTTYVDPTFATNWAGMKAAGVVRGAYHFFRANVDPIQQANHVVATVGMLEPGDLPITLDLETADGQTGATIGANAVTFLDAVTRATGKTAIVYTSPGFVTGTIGSPPAALGHYTLWVANWGVTCPDVPAPWSTWAFWQHADNGTVAGVPATAVDLDTFNGTLAQLKAFGGSPTPDAGAPHDGGAHDGATGDAASAGDGGPIAQGDGGPIAQGDAGPVGPTGADGGDTNWNAATSQSGGCAMGGATPRSSSLLALGAIAIAAGARRARKRTRG